MLRLQDRVNDQVDREKRTLENFALDFRVAAPGIIMAVDYMRQTCTVQLALKERFSDAKGHVKWLKIPLLPDVPFFVYSGGGYCLTLPIQIGDDCLVVFGDNCIDAWWQNGGVQNQIERRRHDLSDGFAIVGFRSQPQIITNYNPTTTQLRNKTGTAYIEIAGDTINIKATNVNITSTKDVTETIGGNLTKNIGGAAKTNAGSVDIGGSTTIDGRTFLGHTHGGVDSGPSSTAGVN